MRLVQEQLEWFERTAVSRAQKFETYPMWGAKFCLAVQVK